MRIPSRHMPAMREGQCCARVPLLRASPLIFLGAIALLVLAPHKVVLSQGANGDFVVVSIGDSFASGEGNPEEKAAELPADPNAPSAQLKQFKPAVWLDPEHCHRSRHAAPTLAADDLKARLAPRPVLYKSFACTGDTIPKVIKQIAEVQKWATGGNGTDHIDVLLISVGGDDIGFGEIISRCIFGLEAAKKWQTQVAFDCLKDKELQKAVADAFKSLPDGYSKLITAVNKLKSGEPIDGSSSERVNPVEIRNVLVTEYPNPAQDERKNPCNLGPLGDYLAGISTDESKWGGRITAALNGHVKNAISKANSLAVSKGTKWDIVTGIAKDFEGHGYCAPPLQVQAGQTPQGRFFYTLGESQELMTGKIDFLNPKLGSSGTMHPNAAGQDVYRKHILAKLIEVASAQSSSGSSARAVVSTVLVLDTSGSMAAATPCGKDTKLQAATAAARNVTQMIKQEFDAKQSNQAAGLVVFNSTVTENVPPSADFDRVLRTLGSVTPNGGTDIYGALQAAVRSLSAAPAGTKRIVWLLTDGLQSSPERTEAEFFSGNGPVADAVAAQVAVYTIGLGNAGEFNESLLRQIAQRTGGTFFSACERFELQNVYLNFRHTSTGQNVTEFRGEIAQGQTVTAGTIEVPRDTGVLNATAGWPGSTVDLRLIDPKGNVVVQGPAVSVGTTPTTANVVVTNPASGRWTIDLFGRDISRPKEPYYAIVSTRPAVSTSSGSSGSSALPVVVTLSVAALGLGVVVFAMRRPRGRRLVLAGSGGFALPLRSGEYLIGRDPACAVRLQDEQASRLHARLALSRDGIMIEDLGSSHGTYVNGVRVQRAPLNPGDVIRAGGTTLQVQGAP